MANYVIIAPRAAGQPMVQPPAAIAPLDEAHRAAKMGRDGRANDSYAFDVAPSSARFRGSSAPSSAPYNMPARRAQDAVERGDSCSFSAQRLSQETDADPRISARLPTAIAAYIRARDSHIEILSSFQTLDIRV